MCNCSGEEQIFEIVLFLLKHFTKYSGADIHCFRNTSVSSSSRVDKNEKHELWEDCSVSTARICDKVMTPFGYTVSILSTFQ